MKLKNKNNSWFSIVMVVFVVWFMLMLTTWTFNLILKELNDNKWSWSNLNAFAWAEWSQELALLKIKEKSYWIDDDIKFDNNVDSRSVILSQNPIDKNLYSAVRDTLISYNLNYKTTNYTSNIEPLSYSIIPLFYIDSGSITHWITDLKLTSDISDNIVWNIVWTWAWISWTWIITDSNSISWAKKSISEISWNIEQSFENQNISEFLWPNWWENYLIIFNSNENSSWSFTLTSWKEFTKPETEIISSAKVWYYKQNLKTKINNTEFLNILKYSIFSWE